MSCFSPLSLNKKLFFYFISINDIQLKMFAFVVVKMLILYNKNAYAVRTS